MYMHFIIYKYIKTIYIYMLRYMHTYTYIYNMHIYIYIHIQMCVKQYLYDSVLGATPIATTGNTPPQHSRATG